MAKNTQQDTQLEVAADVVAQVPSTPDAPITQGQLIALLQTLMQGQNEQQSVLAKSIVEGMREAAKPYVDPKAEENNEKFRQMAREQERQRISNERAAQEACPHIAGCNGLSHFRDYMGRTCIIWHRLDSGETVGLCGNCQKEFRVTDPEFGKWRGMPSISQPSEGGKRDHYFARKQESSRVADLERQLAEANAKIQNQEQTVV